MRFALIALALLGTLGCARAHANKQTLVTSDCGVSWDLIAPGSVVPNPMGMPCSYNITVPDFPMQGEVRFKTSFANRVLADVEIGYEYAIVDAKAFINEAKYLGKSGATDANDSGYESAENTVIDKRIREVVTTILVDQDIVDFSQAEFEDLLLERVNELLAPKGVRLNFLSFVPIPEEQTRLAIDMMTAHKIYESRGLADLGHDISVARAGATKITISDAAPK